MGIISVGTNLNRLSHYQKLDNYIMIDYHRLVFTKYFVSIPDEMLQHILPASLNSNFYREHALIFWQNPQI